MVLILTRKQPELLASAVLMRDILTTALTIILISQNGPLTTCLIFCISTIRWTRMSTMSLWLRTEESSTGKLSAYFLSCQIASLQMSRSGGAKLGCVSIRVSPSMTLR